MLDSFRAARLALPNAVVVVDRFHLVALANRAVTEYRRELAWARRGRRGRRIDPEWAQRNRLLRAGESLTEIAQLRRLAWTVYAWQPSIIEGLLTGISNGRTEGYNRIVKHVGRIAFGFRNQENQKRRIRFPCTRKSRRAPTRPLNPC